MIKIGRKIIISSLVIFLLITSVVAIFYPSAKNGNPSIEEGYLFTFAQLTDSHFSGSRSKLESAVSWLAERNNLSFVVHTGDIVNDPLDEAAWRYAHAYMHRLDGRCSWAVLAGDNDVVSSNRLYTANFERYFGNISVDRYFIVGGKLLFILLGWNSLDGRISEERLEWMDNLIEDHKDLHVVVCLHLCLFNLPILSLASVANAGEVLEHIERHGNVVMTLSGHIHISWVQVHVSREKKVWLLSTSALEYEGYIRLFDVYEDRIEVYAYSPLTGKTYNGVLDRFTIGLNSKSLDEDGDFWSDSLDLMPTHPLVPNIILLQALAAATFITYFVKLRRK